MKKTCLTEMIDYLQSQNEIQDIVCILGYRYSASDISLLCEQMTPRHLTLVSDIPSAPGIVMKRLEAFSSFQPDSIELLSQEEFLQRHSKEPLTAVMLCGEFSAELLESYSDLCAKHLVGKGYTDKATEAYTIWETFRCNVEHFFLCTEKIDGIDVLKWDRNESGIALSVVFPMYKVEEYLPQCIDSVIAWDADYVEYLFVDDGSPDGCAGIIEEYAKKDPRVKLVSKENGGCASARQLGMETAKGRYVGFVDPDDFIDPSMFHKLLKAAMTGSYEISYCGYSQYFDNTGTSQIVPDQIDAPFCDGVRDKALIHSLTAYLRVAIWRGIYRMDMIERNKLHFYTELRRFDDLPFKFEVFAVANSVIAVPESLYYYRLSRPGQDVSADDERLYVHFDIFKHLDESIGKIGDPILLDHLQMCKLHTHQFALGKIKRNLMRSYCRQAKKDMQSNTSFSRNMKLYRMRTRKKERLLYVGIQLNNMSIVRYCTKGAKKSTSAKLAEKLLKLK